MNKTIFVLGDIHFPYQNQSAINKSLALIKKIKPTYIVQIGDLYDQYFASRYSKSLNFTTPEAELSKAVKLATKMWKDILEVSPNSKCIQLLGNHDMRLHKRIQDKLPEIEAIIKQPLKDLYTFQGVKTIFDSRQEVELEGLLFHHGYLSQLGAHVKKYNKSIIVGHSHHAGVHYHKHNDKILFEFNVGFLADKNTLPLNYGEAKLKFWTLGCGLITKRLGKWEPQFISFE